MSRADRAAALTKRRQAISVIKNVRYTRRMITTHEFTAELFDKINGEDRGIENLVGHPVLFSALTESEKMQTRREINAALDKSESNAFVDLRDATIAYFADLQKVIDRLDDVKITDKQIQDLRVQNDAAIEAFDGMKIPEGALDYERCMSTLEHLEIVAEDVEQNIPEIAQEVEPEEEPEPATPEYHEEDHQHDEPPVNEPDEPVVLPDPTTPTEPIEEPGSEDDPAVDLTWIRGEEEFFISAKQFVIPTEEFMLEAGFTPEKASAVLAKYAGSLKKYRLLLQKVKDQVAPETCVGEDLLGGSTKFYQKLDRLVTLVENFETLRDSLNKSCESLLSASHQMLLTASRNPLL